MAELKDTYVVHTALMRCSMGMRETYLVLEDTHGVFLRQQPQMTVEDCIGGVHVRCFGGCYSMENPDALVPFYLGQLFVNFLSDIVPFHFYYTCFSPPVPALSPHTG